jgi:hypothetical protein
MLRGAAWLRTGRRTGPAAVEGRPRLVAMTETSPVTGPMPGGHARQNIEPPVRDASRPYRGGRGLGLT